LRFPAVVGVAVSEAACVCAGVAGHAGGEAMSEPHVHEPAGPGEYCTGCFDQGAVWALHEERARIIAIIEEWADMTRFPTMSLLAAIKEHQ
jgi:hypothetical protein